MRRRPLALLPSSSFALGRPRPSQTGRRRPSRRRSPTKPGPWRSIPPSAFALRYRGYAEYDLERQRERNHRSRCRAQDSARQRGCAANSRRGKVLPQRRGGARSPTKTRPTHWYPKTRSSTGCAVPPSTNSRTTPRRWLTRAPRSRSSRAAPSRCAFAVRAKFFLDDNAGRRYRRNGRAPYQPEIRGSAADARRGQVLCGRRPRRGRRRECGLGTLAARTPTR